LEPIPEGNWLNVAFAIMLLSAALLLGFQTWAAAGLRRSPARFPLAFVGSCILFVLQGPLGVALGLYALWVVYYRPGS
jgi:hypothetical protein